jgi:hypothetical protein
MIAIIVPPLNPFHNALDAKPLFTPVSRATALSLPDITVLDEGTIVGKPKVSCHI